MPRSGNATVLLPALAVLAALTAAAPGSAETWAEKLGWNATDKVLIRHADDAGMFPTANTAIQRGLTKGEIDSTSAMAPLHFFGPMMKWYRSHPDQDVGLHLTLTSEWKYYRWGPSADPPETVKRILGRHMLLRKELPLLWLYRAPTTVGREIQAQINFALRTMNPGRPQCVPPGTGPPHWEAPARDWRIPAGCLFPTHLDSHMGILYLRRSYFRKFIGRVLKNDLLPITFEDFEGTYDCMKRAKGISLSPKVRGWLFRRLQKVQEEIGSLPDWPYHRRPFPRLDRYCALVYGRTFPQTRYQLVQFLGRLEPGITMVLFHPTDPSSLLDVATHQAEVREWDAKLFADPQVKAAMAGIETTTWRDMIARCQANSICP